MKNCLKILIIVVQFHCLKISSQHINDTILLSPVEIVSGNYKNMQFRNFDSLSSVQYSLTGIAEKMKFYTPVFIKEYSPGGITTVSFTGTGAAHTLVLFDGFSVNPVMSGQADLSALPPYLYDKMLIIPAPESLLLHPSTLGGLISLHTVADSDYNYGISLRAEAGSFRNFGSAGQIHKKFNKYLFRTRFYYHESDNNFPFINNSMPDMPLQKRVNAGFQKKGLMQEVFRKNDDNILFVKFTALSHFNQLPAMLFQPQIEDNEHQQNDITRIVAGYSKTKSRNYFSVKTQFCKESWLYHNKLINTESKNDIFSVSVLGNYILRLRKHSELSVQWNSDFQHVETNNYLEPVRVNNNRLTFGGIMGKHNFIAKPVAHFLFNEDRSDISGALLVRKMLFKEKLMINITGGRSVRYPGLNDLYWVPGGNPDLHPETAHTSSAVMEFIFSETWTIQGETGFSHVNNWILWQPVSGSAIWTPENVRKVNISKLNLMNIFRFKLFGFSCESAASYSYCVSLDKSDIMSEMFNKQLIYVPMHIGAHSIKISYNRLSVSVESHYTGKRYTRADNLSYMPAHFHHNILLKWKHKKNILEFFAGLYNATNENYQIIAWQPMPRCYFKFSVQIGFYEKK